MISINATFSETLIITYVTLVGIFFTLLLLTKRANLEKERQAWLPYSGNRIKILNLILYIALILYTALLILSITLHIDSGIWLSGFLSMYAIIFFIIFNFSHYNVDGKNILSLSNICVYVMALTLLIISSSVSGFKPLSNDEDRYIGFSYRIIDDGHWVPYKYPENPYYQSFHTLPATISIVSLITKGAPEMDVYIILKIAFAILNISVLYIIANKLLYLYTQKIKSSLLSLMIPLVAMVIPPLSIFGLLPRNFSYVLFLLSFYLILRIINNGTLLLEVIAPLTICSFTSMLMHPTGPYLTSLLALSLGVYKLTCSKSIKPRGVIISALKIIMILLIIYQFYWLYSFAVFSYAQSIKNLWTGLLEFIKKIITEGEPLTKYATREPWYEAAPKYLLIAWAFLPALATAWILYRISANTKSYSARNEATKFLDVLGIISLLAISLAFIQRFTSGLTVYLGYKTYSLLLPLLLLYSFRMRRMRTSLYYLFVMLIISCSAIGVTAPEINPSALNIRPTATDTGWMTAKLLHRFITDQYRKNIMREVRIGLNVFILKEKPALFEFYSHKLESRTVFSIFKNIATTSYYGGNHNIVFDNGIYIALLGKQRIRNNIHFRTQ